MYLALVNDLFAGRRHDLWARIKPSMLGRVKGHSLLLSGVPSRKRRKPKKTKAAIALAKVLRVHRHDLGLSQEAFAERVGLSKNYIGNLERGEYEPSVSALVAIARELNLQASGLLLEAGY